MGDARKNFAYSTVAVAPTPATSGTSLTVATGTGVLFPVAPFNVTVWPTTAQPTTANAEIVRVTAVVADVLTIERAAESSTARTIIAGDQIAATITAKTLMDVDVSFELGRNRVGLWLPSGNSATVPGVVGMLAMTVLGTATARNIASTTYFTRSKRIGFVSVATVGGLAGVRIPAGQVTLGAGGLVGGFRMITRFGASDAAAVAGARQFVGVSGVIAAPTNVEPSTLVNVIGVGHGTADTNLKLFYGGSTAQTPIDLGVNFPANTLSVDLYELELEAPTTDASVRYTVTRLNTGNTTSGTIAAGVAGVTLPAVATLLSLMQGWRTNNATALAVGLDMTSIYTEVR